MKEHQILIKNKSRFSKVLYNYYREANIQEGFDKFLQRESARRFVEWIKNFKFETKRL